MISIVNGLISEKKILDGTRSELPYEQLSRVVACLEAGSGKGPDFISCCSW